MTEEPDLPSVLRDRREKLDKLIQAASSPRTGSRSEGDLKLMSEEQVSTTTPCRLRKIWPKVGKEEADKFEHPHRLVDPAARVLPVALTAASHLITPPACTRG